MKIDRRDFLKVATFTFGMNTLFNLVGCTNGIERRIENDIDRFGGWKKKKLTKTDYFHTEHDGKRWWLVTPEGHPFISFGINHYHADWWIQDYNCDYWLKTFGGQKPWDEQWQKGFRKIAGADLQRLGINTLGMHTDAPMLTDQPYGAIIPYLKSYKPIVLDHYRHPKPEAYVDVFAPEFEKLCDETAQKIAAPYADDPMLLGYCMSDCPIFTDEDVRSMGGSTTWPRILRNLGAKAPGKHAYVAAMQKNYANIGAFNKTYNTAFKSWNDLVEAENWRSDVSPVNTNEQADNDAFMLVCVDRYYSVAKAALLRFDPYHLFFGDKLNGNTNNMDKVLEVAGRHVDVILYQFYGLWAEQKNLLDKFAPRVNIPLLNGDAGFSVPGEMMPSPYGPHARNQAERAAWLIECCKGGFSRPEFVGWHMCGIIDTWKTMPGKEHYQHQGLMTITGEFYPEMEHAVKDISSQLYTIASMNRMQ